MQFLDASPDVAAATRRAITEIMKSELAASGIEAGDRALATEVLVGCGWTFRTVDTLIKDVLGET